MIKLVGELVGVHTKKIPAFRNKPSNDAAWFGDVHVKVKSIRGRPVWVTEIQKTEDLLDNKTLRRGL